MREMSCVGRVRIARVLVACMATLLVGCASPPARPVFIESPVPLIAGSTLVTPVATGAAGWATDGAEAPTSLRLGDGQHVDADARSYERIASASDTRGWLGPTQRWRTTSRTTDNAMTVILADLPVEALGQSMWMEGRRIPAFWLVPDVSGRDGLRPSPIESGASVSQAIELVARELSDPEIRWRAELALQRLGHEPPPPAWDDAVLRAWAEQSAERWDAAVRRLSFIDEALTARLLDNLTRWLVTPEVTVPVWETDGDAISELIRTILRPGASDESIRRTVAAFLERQPQWLAWVANDAGGVVGGAIAVVNLSSSPALLSTRPPAGRWEAYGMLEPGALALVPAPPRPDATSRASAWQVRLGGRTKSLDVSVDAIALEPPGLSMGPFWLDWTLGGLIDGTGQTISRGRPGWIGGLVQRDPRLNSPGSSESGWVLYMEVRRPPCEMPSTAGSPQPLDAVRVALGPTSRPRAQVVVRCSGLTTFEGGAPGASAILTKDSDRWAFTLPIDRTWFEPDGTLLIGAQFVPHDGPRATWPRPLLPGQDTIGRVRLDPSAWNLHTSVRRRVGDAGAP